MNHTEPIAEGDYFDLSLVPERFTGYSGLSAHNVWRSIYEENCFGLSELNLMGRKSLAAVSLPESMSEVFRDGGIEPDEQCLEKRVYYKVISGLRISYLLSLHTHHFLHRTSRIHFYSHLPGIPQSDHWRMGKLNFSPNVNRKQIVVQAPNLECFIDRVVSHPERLQYIYFNTVLMLRAVARLGPYLSAFDYCSTGNHEDDQQTLAKIFSVVDIAQNVGKFDETLLFRGEDANVSAVSFLCTVLLILIVLQILKEEFKTHFRNVTRIMDCVGCAKCRLWGKVQTTGLATAMKILFEMDEKALE